MYAQKQDSKMEVEFSGSYCVSPGADWPECNSIQVPLTIT